MSQKHYTERVLECFGMSNCKPHSAPCTEDINKDQEKSSELPIPRVYREIVDSLIYAMTATRPDISYVVTKLSQKMSNPTERDLSYAKEVLRYLKGTIDHSLIFSKEDEIQIQGYTVIQTGHQLLIRKVYLDMFSKWLKVVALFPGKVKSNQL